MDFKDKFRIVASKDLKASDFSYHPLWSVYEDFDEIDEIASWGINKEEAHQALMDNFIDQIHPYYTVPVEAFPPSRLCFFCKAVFTTSGGRQIDGAIMNGGTLVVKLFLDNDEMETISYHPGLRIMAINTLKKVSKRLNLDFSELRKLQFETVIPIAKDKRIRGELTMD